MEEIRTAGAIAVVIIGFLGILVSDRGWMFFSKCRQAIRDTWVRATGRILRPVSRRYRQWRYKDRITKLEPASYDEYDQLLDADKLLFKEFKGAKLRRLLHDRFKELNRGIEESGRLIETMDSERRKKITAGGPLVKISGTDDRIICGNCAFFAADFEKDHTGDLQVSTLKGECHKDPTTQVVDPFSVCSHHSALQGFAPSTHGFYVFATPKRQETPR